MNKPIIISILFLSLHFSNPISFFNESYQKIFYLPFSGPLDIQFQTYILNLKEILICNESINKIFNVQRVNITHYSVRIYKENLTDDYETTKLWKVSLPYNKDDFLENKQEIIIIFKNKSKLLNWNFGPVVTNINNRYSEIKSTKALLDNCMIDAFILTINIAENWYFLTVEYTDKQLSRWYFVDFCQNDCYISEMLIIIGHLYIATNKSLLRSENIYNTPNNINHTLKYNYIVNVSYSQCDNLLANHLTSASHCSDNLIKFRMLSWIYICENGYSEMHIFNVSEISFTKIELRGFRTNSIVSDLIYSYYDNVLLVAYQNSFIEFYSVKNMNSIIEIEAIPYASHELDYCNFFRTLFNPKTNDFYVYCHKIFWFRLPLDMPRLIYTSGDIQNVYINIVGDIIILTKENKLLVTQNDYHYVTINENLNHSQTFLFYLQTVFLLVYVDDWGDDFQNTSFRMLSPKIEYKLNDDYLPLNFNSISYNINQMKIVGGIFIKDKPLRSMIVSSSHIGDFLILQIIGNEVINVIPIKKPKSTFLKNLKIQNWKKDLKSGEFLISSGTWNESNINNSIIIFGYGTFVILQVNAQIAHVKLLLDYQPKFIDTNCNGALYDTQGAWQLKIDQCRLAVEYFIDGVRNMKTELCICPYRKRNITIRAHVIEPLIVGNYPLIFYLFPSNLKLNIKMYRFKMTIYNYEEFTIILQSKFLIEGISVIQIWFPLASLVCPITRIIFLVRNTCCSNFLLNFDLISNASIYFNLPFNYQPPLAFRQKASNNIYNANPAFPLSSHNYQKSLQIGKYKQCFGKKTQEDCNCPKHLKKPNESITDCITKVRTLLKTGVIEVKFSLTKGILDSTLLVVISEINNRPFQIADKPKKKNSTYVKMMLEDERTREIANGSLVHDSFNIIVTGYELYHFKAKVISNLTFCPLESHLLVYVMNDDEMHGLFLFLILCSIFYASAILIIFCLIFFKEIKLH